MSKRRQYLQFVAEFTVYGGIVGIFLGVLYIFVWFLWIYGVFLPILFNMIVGMILGLVNGLRLGYLKFYQPGNDNKQFQRRMRNNAIAATFLSSIILYAVIFYPLIHSTSPSTAVQGSLFAGFPPSVVAIFIAWYASIRISNWQPDKPPIDV